MKRYIYPSFSRIDLGFIRFGGPGLANLLFIFSRAILLAKRENAKIIWPTWRSIKIGPWIRREKDKRFYGNLFSNDGNYISGLKKEFLLFLPKIHISSVEEEIPDGWEGIIAYSAFDLSFSDFLDARTDIKNQLLSIAIPTNKAVLNDDFSRSINVHVRMGDFLSNSDMDPHKKLVNTRIPVEWYVKIITDLQSIFGDAIMFNIFSDGSDVELSALLNLPNVQRCFYGNAFSDMVALSRSKVIIASASSFSLWARYLGNTSCFTFKNQLMENVCTDPCGFEYECGFSDLIPEDIISKIKFLYSLE